MLQVPVLDLDLTRAKYEEKVNQKYVLANNELLSIERNSDGSVQSISQHALIGELGKQLLNAACNGDCNEINSLIKQGAPFTADWLGTSPLHLAAQNNHLDACVLLLKEGISKDARTKVDRTPLHLAAYNGNAEVVECLINYGAEINCTDMLQMTPLHWAIQNCHVNVVSVLLHHGADPQAVNKFELTPYDIAMQMQHHEIAQLLTAALTMKDNIHMVNESSNDSGLEPSLENQLSENDLTIPIETILLEDMDGEQTMNSNSSVFNSLFSKQAHVTAEVESMKQEIENDEEAQNEPKEDFADTVKLLQQHGITMLPPDNSNIFTSVMDSGHQVVLTDIGKEMLNSTKPEEKSPAAFVKATQKSQKQKTGNVVSVKTQKIITVTPEEFLAMTTDLNSSAQFSKVENKNEVPQKSLKRVVLKKNKVLPVILDDDGQNDEEKSEVSMSDMELLMTQLIELKKQANIYKKQAEEYKNKYLLKDAEAKMYKEQLMALQQNCDFSN